MSTGEVKEEEEEGELELAVHCLSVCPEEAACFSSKVFEVIIDHDASSSGTYPSSLSI